jgi:hypothetical protein
MAGTYQINTPVTFVNTNGTTDFINFQADGPIANTLNKMRNFVVTTAGDMLYRAAGGVNDLERLPIGTAGQVLTVVAGLPAWTTGTAPPTTANTSFSAFTTASPAPIAASATWTQLDSTSVTWSTTAPSGTDTGTMFNAATGVVTIPVTGGYLISGQVSFQGNNTGDGTTIAGRTSIRQARIQKTNATAATLSESQEQANASNLDPLSIVLASKVVSLTAADTLRIEIRHDATTALDMVFDGSASTLFSVMRVF